MTVTEDTRHEEEELRQQDKFTPVLFTPVLYLIMQGSWRAWWCAPVVIARWRQEEWESRASLGYITSLRLAGLFETAFKKKKHLHSGPLVVPSG